MAQKNAFINFIDELPWVAKIILCLFGLDVIWAIYRIIKGATQNDTVILVAGIIWVLGAFSIGWIVDLVSVIVLKHPLLA